MKLKSADSAIKIKKVMAEFWKKKIDFKKVKLLSAKPLWFYLEEDKEIIAFINGYLLDYGFNKEAIIENLEVKKKFRGKGNSKKLMDEFINQCKKEKVSVLDLSVKDNNTIAKKLYKKYKFKKDNSGLHTMSLYLK